MESRYREQGVAFDCEGETLIGVIAQSPRPARRGVLIVVGGPQYRGGSHRQFVLLGRELAGRGIATMRFDYRGMGDSTGAMRSFEHVGADIRAALDCFFGCVQELREVALWGLCDGASASMFYAHQDPRVCGLVLLNPWVRTEAGEAKAYLKHYYLKRALNRDFWAKTLSGQFNVRASLASLAETVRRAAAGGGREQSETAAGSGTLPERMADSLRRFGGRALFVLSGNDLTAKEFVDVAEASPSWRKLLESSRVSRMELPHANHTFSSRVWRDRVVDHTHQWLLCE